jgi:hypothetical protein
MGRGMRYEIGLRPFQLADTGADQKSPERLSCRFAGSPIVSLELNILLQQTALDAAQRAAEAELAVNEAGLAW